MYIPKRNIASSSASKYDNMDIVNTYADLPIGGDTNEKIYYVKDTQNHYLYDKTNSIYIQILKDEQEPRIITLEDSVTLINSNVATLNTFKGNQETLNLSYDGKILSLETTRGTHEFRLIDLETLTSVSLPNGITALGTRVFNLENINASYRIGQLELTDGLYSTRINTLESKLYMGGNSLILATIGNTTIFNTVQEIGTTDTPTFNNLTLSTVPTSSTINNFFTYDLTTKQMNYMTFSTLYTSLIGTLTGVNNIVISGTGNARTFNTIQNIRTTDTPTFVNLTLSTVPTSITINNFFTYDLTTKKMNYMTFSTLYTLIIGTLTGVNNIVISGSGTTRTFDTIQNIRTTDTPTFNNINLSSNQIRLGYLSGTTTQATNTVAIGDNAGNSGQAIYSIAIGSNAGKTSQQTGSVAIGPYAGSVSQGASSIGIGAFAGNLSQASDCIAIGKYSGQTSQKADAISIGNFAGNQNQEVGSIAIGSNAGRNSMQAYSIALGYNADYNGSYQKTICINATSIALEPLYESSFYVKPIRSITYSTEKVLVYNTTTSEVSYANTGKTFVINHPIENNKFLVHSCLEGPEAGIYYRGIGEITDGNSVIIKLPEYCLNFFDHTIQVTQIYEENINVMPCAASLVKDNKFKVKSYGNCKFYYLVHCKRFNIEVEPLKEDWTLKGDGPYTYLTRQRSAST